MSYYRTRDSGVQLIKGLKLITPPIVEPITLNEAKRHLRIGLDESDEDGDILDLISVAREYCEGTQKKVYNTQTWQLTLDSFPQMPIKIPKPPFQTLENVVYKDVNGNEVNMALNNFAVDNDSEQGRITFAPYKSWPSVNLWPISAVKFKFKAGYGDDPVNVPEKVKQAMKLLIGYWYENREAAVSGTVSREVEFSVNALLGFDRVVSV